MESTDVNILSDNVRDFMLLAEICRGNEDDEDAQIAIQKAHKLQRRIVDKMRGEQPELIRQHKIKAAATCCKIAQFFASEELGRKDSGDRVIQFYSEALRFDDTNEKALLSLARIYLEREELDQCMHQCITLLRIDTEMKMPV